jgi:RNA polymerase sigma-32 factor
MLQISNPDWVAHQRVLAHQPLARKIARAYAADSLSPEDLLSAANIGLLEAVKRFDEDRGCAFGTYARYWARAECRKFVLANASIVERPRPAPGKKETIPRDTSLSAPLGDDGGEVGDLLESEGDSPELELTEREDAAERRDRLLVAMGALTDREREILTARQLQDKPTALQILAARFMISLERVRQIEGEAFRKVQKRIAKKPLLPAQIRPGYARQLRAETLRKPPKDLCDIILRHAVTGSFGFDHS